MNENEDYLTNQIITYIGNKRSLLDFIGESVNKVKQELNKDKLDIIDIFSGSGIVARYLKSSSNLLITNDLEEYSYVINNCYLSNVSEINMEELKKYYNILKDELSKGFKKGFISKEYAPVNSNEIKKGESVFFTTRNANYIDTARMIIETFPEHIKNYFIAPLLSEASIKNNTAGVFKGFYKNKKDIGQFGGEAENALTRIKADIEIPFPIFSNYECNVKNYKMDANELVDELDEVDLVYMDPPYNQHPYGSNYFMLNLISDYKEPEIISEVAGIPKKWNRSRYNQKREALNFLSNLCKRVKAKYLLISFNSEGFISKEEMEIMLNEVGNVTTLVYENYNVYRASRNLKNREKHVDEYLFLVKKGDLK